MALSLRAEEMLWCPLKEGEEQEGGMAGVVPTVRRKISQLPMLIL